MSQLKIYAVMLMYLYIMLFAINNGNTTAVIIAGILFIIYAKTVLYTNRSNVNLKIRLNRQREYFINSLSHDLRIPTIAQIRALDLVKSEKFGVLNDVQKDMLEQIEESCKCILNLLSLMINTYSMEKNNYKLIYEKINLAEIISSCFDELYPKAAEKQITFEYDSKIKNLYITADKAELKKVIINILLNSISNAYTGEKISITAKSGYKKIRFTFSCKNKAKYFSDNESNYTSVGQSIIMSFCKKIIEIHKGKIIENNNLNSFSFELPEYSV